MTAQDPTARTVAFVTGAAYGIGAATAVGLARDGFDVAVSELRPENLTETVKAVTAAGARAVPVELDVRSLPSIRKAMAQVLAAFGHLDALVNNAGVPLTRPALEVTEAEWDEVLDVNLLAIEWADRHIRVNAVAPGTVETPSRAAVLAADPRRREFLMNRVPMKRFGTAEEMAAAVCYLASPRAAYITGQTLLVDGGLTSY